MIRPRSTSPRRQRGWAEAEEAVRLTTNIIECDNDDLEIGMPVEVQFEECDDVFLPMFKPAGREDS